MSSISRVRLRVIFLVLVIMVTLSALHRPTKNAVHRATTNVVQSIAQQQNPYSHETGWDDDAWRVESGRGWENGNKMTRIHTHAPGYTVFENLYYQNRTYYILTSEPWAIPDLRLVARRINYRHPELSREGIKILTVRGPAPAPQDESKLLGESITVDNALSMSENAVDLDSPMMLCNDDLFVSHYYHWIGETFLGLWRVWKHWEWARAVRLPEFSTISFANTYPRGQENLDIEKFTWEDGPGVNKFLMEAWFPDAKFETRLEWEARDETNQVYRMPLVAFGDRHAGQNGPGAEFKPWGDALRIPVAADYLAELRDRVLRTYAGPVDLKHGTRPKVVYLSRQDTGRRLSDEAHDRLVAALEELRDEGLVDFSIIQFSKEVPLIDQVASMATIDFLVSVHGNGLTHSLWMQPGQGRAVFEMQPHQCSFNDYSPLAVAANLQHFLVRETELCEPLDCPKRGCNDTESDKRGVNREDIDVQPKIITDKIRDIIARHHDATTENRL